MSLLVDRGLAGRLAEVDAMGDRVITDAAIDALPVYGQDPVRAPRRSPWADVPADLRGL